MRYAIVVVATKELAKMTQASEFRVMDRSGDGLKLSWNSENDQEVEAARTTFNDYRSRGYDLFSLGDGDERGERMREFDPDVAGILAIPRMRGG
jgi:hypothetical protein